jgi:hypothetical protein
VLKCQNISQLLKLINGHTILLKRLIQFVRKIYDRIFEELLYNKIRPLLAGSHKFLFKGVYMDSIKGKVSSTGGTGGHDPYSKHFRRLLALNSKEIFRIIKIFFSDRAFLRGIWLLFSIGSLLKKRVSLIFVNFAMKII